MSKLRAKDYPNIVKKYQSGISQVEIGKDYGVSSQYIGRILKKYKVPGRVGGYSSPKLEVRANHRRILGLFQDGYTITQVAKQLDAPSSYLQTIEDEGKAYQQGQPLPGATKATMRRDINQLAYNKLSTGLSQKDPQAFLVRLAANAAKAGIRPTQIKEILSLSPAMKEIQQQQGEKVSSDRITKIIAEGLHLKNREQPRQRSFQQQRSQQIDHGPSLGM
jgi:hypothetical protein